MFTIVAIGVSVFVAIIQYAQWRTANQKVVVDLFDRRLKVYDNFRDVIVEIAQTGEAHPEASRRFWRVRAEAEFLFGDDVQRFLIPINNDIIKLHSLRVVSEGPDFLATIERKSQIFERIVATLSDAPGVFRPYIGLTQKNTPFWRPW